MAVQRCVIPTSGYYEQDSGKHKYFFQLPGEPIYLAGIYDNIEGVNRFVILTTVPHETVQDIHDRIPLILSAMNRFGHGLPTHSLRYNC